jgi:flagellar hook-associated protein 3 FlgL
MRIATSTIYSQQTSAIDTLVAQEETYAEQLSSGYKVNIPSDDPTQIAQDLSVRSDITVQTQIGTNATNTSNELTSVDGTLSSLNNILQSAYSLTVDAANGTNSSENLQSMATQVQQLLQEAVGLANTPYAGSYIFAGTAQPNQPPVTLDTGNPAIVDFTGNQVAQTQELPNGQSIPTSVTLQQAFNYDAADGSPSVFQVLQNLYNTLENGQVSDTSSAQINAAGASITANTTLAQLEAPGSSAATPLTLDNGVPPQVSITITGASSASGTTLTFAPTETVAQVVQAINGASASTGVSASFDYQTDRLSLTSATSFTVGDTPTPASGATSSGNFLETFNLQGTASVSENLSQQLGDINNVTQVVLGARTQLGTTIQELNSISTSSSAEVTSDTTIQTDIEDTNVAQVQPELSLTQTALEAAYSTTAQLEQKDLFDYLTTT